MDRVEELEAAILARAHRLASEYREGAEQSRDNILRNASQQLHLREEREVLLAKAQAERRIAPTLCGSVTWSSISSSPSARTS